MTWVEWKRSLTDMAEGSLRKGGSVAYREDEQGPHNCLWMNGGPAKVGTVPMVQVRERLGEIQLLVNPGSTGG